MKRSLPIRRRLALIIAVSLGVSLLLTSLFFAARQIEQDFLVGVGYRKLLCGRHRVDTRHGRE